MPKLKLRILFNDSMLGPGKAELLQKIVETGSISAAGRQMGMSYKRAWGLVEEMNRAFAEPLVISARGGTGGGGAQVTEAGLRVIQLYQAIIERTLQATQQEIAALEEMLDRNNSADMSTGK